jgi:two-component system, chemotaxis family, chemotaxis protein CheY
MAVDRNMKVLVVDDYQTMVQIIRNLLRQLGFVSIDEANDGSAALDMMRQKDYGLVISDWHMAPMSGFELLREVRADDRLSQTPFIMVTAENRAEKVIEAKKAGANTYIVKPVNAATLKSRIDDMFADQLPD